MVTVLTKVVTATDSARHTGAQWAVREWEQAAAAGEPWHLPAHLAIVPSGTTAAARVDLLELSGPLLSLLTVRFRSLSLSTHTRIGHDKL